MCMLALLVALSAGCTALPYGALAGVSGGLTENDRPGLRTAEHADVGPAAG
jgi:hypothetical protein